MAVGDIETEAPDPTGVPPHDPLYHSQFAAVPREPPLNVKVVELPLHNIAGVAFADVAATEFDSTLMVIFVHKLVLQVPTARTK